VNLGPSDSPQCPRECDHFCILKSNGPICSCKPGFRLYDDLKTCVLTEQLLEEAAEELSDDVALPVVIVLIVGFLVILCMAIVTWYCVTRDTIPSQIGSQNSLPIGIKTLNKPLHISIV
jgi:hypothetical protein